MPKMSRSDLRYLLYTMRLEAKQQIHALLSRISDGEFDISVNGYWYDAKMGLLMVDISFVEVSLQVQNNVIVPMHSNRLNDAFINSYESVALITEVRK